VPANHDLKRRTLDVHCEIDDGFALCGGEGDVARNDGEDLRPNDPRWISWEQPGDAEHDPDCDPAKWPPATVLTFKPLNDASP